MIGYKCDHCGHEIPENEYNEYKLTNDLVCKKCQNGHYVPYFKDENKIFDDQNSKQYSYSSQDRSNNENDSKFSSKIKSLIKKTNEQPGATTSNRVIGTVTGVIAGGIIFSGILNIIGLIIGGVAGYIFAPYFVPKMRKLFNKFKKWLSSSTDEN